MSGLLTYNSGLFVTDLTRAFGLTRTGYGAAFFVSTLAMAAAMPLVGWAVDRFGPRATAMFGSMCLSLGFVGLGLWTRSVATYAITMALIGLLAAFCSPVPYTRAVSGAFTRARGLALGLTQMGIGGAAALVPPAISTIIAQHGWRAGYLGLAALAGVGLLPGLALPGRATAKQGGGGGIRAERLPMFRVQMLAFTTMALAFAGVLGQFVPMLREGGLSVTEAGALAGLIGVSVIVTRIVVGWLSDRMEPAWLGAASCAICSAGCLCLGLGGVEMAVIGALALGAAMGAEADLVGILTARYFGVAAYSRAYAAQYAAFILAAGVSPMWVGALADRTGGFQIPLLVASGLLLLPIGLFIAIPTLDRAAGLAIRTGSDGS